MKLTSDQIRERYLAFFKKRNHAIIPSAPLVPENDPTTLFNTAGMQPIIPYLLGEKHPSGVRLADCQKCVRTGDIDDIGDNRHLTFFEMLGNWSLGDYFKKEAINWSLEFLTNGDDVPEGDKGLGLDPKRLYVTTFKGENGIPRDDESIQIWQEAFAKYNIKAEVAGDDEKITGDVRIVPLGVADNFWIAGTTGPCGGDTEMFYDTRPEEGKLAGKFGDLVDSFRLIEIWNDVFMEFNKTADGKYEKLAKRNVDTGMGLERTTAVVNGKSTVFETDCFESFIAKLNEGLEIISELRQRSNRIIADHVRTATFIIADGVTPSNTDRGYILRRIIRRAILHVDQMGLSADTLQKLSEMVIRKYSATYPNLALQEKVIFDEILKEETRFRKTLHNGKQELLKIIGKTQKVTAEDAFNLYQSFGFPLELTKEFAKDIQKNVAIDEKTFFDEFKKHQELSRVGSEKKFKGGLGDTSEKSLQYHTATHLLNAALRQVLGTHVMQKGSNITPERLRFDFSHGEKMTDEQKQKVTELVNGWIVEKLPVAFKEIPKLEAEKIAIHNFNEKYGDIVKVYSIGTEGHYISREFCGGPHVSNTADLHGTFKIQKEEAVSAGVRRIKAILE